jgi:hypothetical protein
MKEEKKRSIPAAALSALVLTGLLFGAVPSDDLAAVKKAVSSGRFAYRITEAEDIKFLLGFPQQEKESRVGGMLSLDLAYGELLISLGKMRESDSPFTLRRILFKGTDLDIGHDKTVVLRGNHDLNKVGRFWGL